MKNLTPSERRALEAVARGEVLRIYRKDGNTFRAPPGLGAATLWRLASRWLIADGATLHHGLDTHVRMQLTVRGKNALASPTLQVVP